VRQASSALEYLHERKIMHLDIKPGNMMLRRKDNRVVLIDFGLSKHYDEQSGEATSTTPVGVSHGYAPMEQYKQGGVNTFSPETDIYSLGATLYYLLTGQRPPEAASLINDPLEFPQHVSATLRSAITAAMSPSSKQRPASVGKFVAMFNKADVTIVERPITHKKPLDNKPKSKSGKWWLWPLLMVVVIAIVCAVVMNVGDETVLFLRSIKEFIKFYKLEELKYKPVKLSRENIREVINIIGFSTDKEATPAFHHGIPNKRSGQCFH
jgi:serine/threonine protein kinase